jgi:hypothetical protein
MGELKVACSVYRRISAALSDKHFVDATVKKGGKLTVPLMDLGTSVTHQGSQVYVSTKGAELIDRWRETNQMPDGFKIVVMEDNALRDWFWGYREEDVEKG